MTPNRSTGVVMGITLKEIAELHPRLYHMAEHGSWPSIRENGLLSTTALLDLYAIKGESRATIESTLRKNMVQVKGKKGETAWIRDQRPMSGQKLAGCLRDGLTPTDWYRMLNGRVFFWLTEARLETLLAAVTLHSNHGFYSEPSAYCTQIADFEACLYSNRGRSAGDWSLNQSLRELFERAAVRRRWSGDGHARLARARLRRPSGSRGIRSDFHNVNPLR
jgi:hypothetical protein